MCCPRKVTKKILDGLKSLQLPDGMSFGPSRINTRRNTFSILLLKGSLLDLRNSLELHVSIDRFGGIWAILGKVHFHELKPETFVDNLQQSLSQI